VLCIRHNLYCILLLSGIFALLTNLLFAFLAMNHEPQVIYLLMVIVADNIAGGIVDTISYTNFFIMTAIIGISVIFLIIFVKDKN